VRAERTGSSLTQAEGWSGQVYAELGYTDLAAWRPWFDYPLELANGQGAVRLWTTVEGGTARQATADVALAGVKARFAGELPLLELDSMSGRLQARHGPDGYQLTARKLALAPRETLPGFARLAGSVEASEASGRLYLQSRGAEIELPRVFPEPRLSFDTLNGQLDWQRDAGVLKVQVGSMTFSNADLSGNAFGSYAYDGEGPGTLDVSAVLNRADAKNLAHYLPLGALMGEKPREWLIKGILAGQASEVQLRLQGDLREFPFTDPARGRFLVTARVHHGRLHYAEGWPQIEDIEAELAFDRNRVDLVGRSGRVLGASLHDVKVSMPELRSRAPRIEVSGQAQGPTAEFLKFIQSSPLRTSAGRFTEGISATGDGRLHLKLELPL